MTKSNEGGQSFAKTKPQAGRQLQAFTTKVDFMIYGGARGAGKALPLESEVHTPYGLKNIGDLQEGDQVFSQDGKPTKVIKLHPISEQQSYKITFDDGTNVVCSPDHLWNAWRANQSVRTNGKRLSGERSQRTVDTKTLIKWVDTANKSSGTKRYPLIPLCGEVDLPSKDLPISPYTLGLLLGDGCITKKSPMCVTSIDTAIIKYLNSNYDTTVDSKQNTDAKSIRFKGDTLINFKDQLTKLGLYGCSSSTKFIPEIYLMASIEQRYEILRGLLDTDGSVDKKGQVYYYSISKDLIQGTKLLIESLGGVCTITSKVGKYKDTNGNVVVCQVCYNLRIKHKNPHKLFKLERKCSITKKCQNFHRKIIDITLEDPSLMRCITVEHDSGLFLTGRNGIVTHNSQLLAMRPLEFVNDPLFSGIFFRREYGELTGSGGLWPKSLGMYPEFGGRKNISNLWWDFPSGARMAMKHMHTEADKEKHRGLGYSFVGFDEIDQFTQEQVQFLLTCLRSEAGMDSFCIGTWIART